MCRLRSVGELRRISIELLLAQAAPLSVCEIADTLPARARAEYWQLLLEEELAVDRGEPTPARLRALERLLASRSDTRGGGR